MIQNTSREIKDEDVTDIIGKIIAYMAIPAAMFMIVIALWTIFITSGNVCGSGIC